MQFRTHILPIVYFHYEPRSEDGVSKAGYDSSFTVVYAEQSAIVHSVLQQMALLSLAGRFLSQTTSSSMCALELISKVLGM